MGKTLKSIQFRARNRRATQGILTVGHMSFRSACGRSGRGILKHEGDGLSPLGSFRLEALLYRSDRMIRPMTALPSQALRDSWAWCESVGDRNYNRLVRVAPETGHDVLKRTDNLYDLIVVTSHNQRPRVRNKGSAIFFHLAREGFQPTAGCIAVSLCAMRAILARCGPKTRLVIY